MIRSLFLLCLLISASFSANITQDNFIRILLDSQDTPGALPYLKPPEDYINKGTVTSMGDLPVYSVGSSTTSGIIFIYDIYGFDAGMTRQFCDNLSTLGYHVVLPDVYRGDNRNKEGFTIDKYTWAKVKADVVKVYNHMTAKGITKIIIAGTCYGGYIAFEASKELDLVAGLTYHPAGARVSNLETLGKDVKCPQLCVASGGEDAVLKEGGKVAIDAKAKFDKSVFKTYESMAHGFVVRGDVKDPAVKKALDETMDITSKFIQSVNPNSVRLLKSSLLLMLSILIFIL